MDSSPAPDVGSGDRLQLHAAAGGEVPGEDLRAAPGPDRPARGGAGGAVHPTGRDAAGADLRRDARAGAGGAGPSSDAVRPEGGAGQWADDAAAGAEVLRPEA